MNNKPLIWTIFGIGAVGLIILAIVVGSSSPAGEPVKLGSRSSIPPESWEREEPSNEMRQAQLRVPKAEDDVADAEVAIFRFPGGGTVEENLKRWKAKFRPPFGKTPEDISTVDTFQVGNVDVTYLDISGTYSDPFAKKPPSPGYRMLGVIFDSDDGPYFITMIGPESTVAANKEGFDKWLKGFE